MRELTIRERDLEGPDALHALVARELAFPDWYGGNLSALADCLGDVCEPTQVTLVPAEPESEWFCRARRVFERMAAENPQLQVVMEPSAGTGVAGSKGGEADKGGNPASPLLEDRPEGLTLVDGTGLELRADLTRLVPRLRPDRLAHELLVRAARVRGVEHPTAIDATAGLGDDSTLLAAAGFSVTLYERDPTIAALLADALARAAADPRLAPIAARMTLVQDDSIAAMQAMADTGAPAPDVVLLDPMFPARTKSALVKKKFQLLHQLKSPAEDEKALLQAALAVRPRKVVVKRMAKGPWLADHKPSYSVAGKSVRYDVIVVPR